MMGSTVHPRSLRGTVQAILKLQSSNSSTITQEEIAAKADLSVRHVGNCLIALQAQEILCCERNVQWRGAGVRYSYIVKIEQAKDQGYIDDDFLTMLDITRERLMAQVA